MAHDGRFGEALSWGFERVADAAMRATLLGSAAYAGARLLSGELPHWAALVGSGLSAAYLAMPTVRALFLGIDAGAARALPASVREDMGKVAVRANLAGDTGIWLVTAGGDVPAFMTEREFVAYAAGLPAPGEIVTAEVRDAAIHVRRYRHGALQSLGEEAALQVFSPDGGLLRAVDYDHGRMTGVRDVGTPPGPGSLSP